MPMATVAKGSLFPAELVKETRDAIDEKEKLIARMKEQLESI